MKNISKPNGRAAIAEGFTLLEIMVTLSVVAILVVVVYHGGRSLVENARITQSMANLRSLAVANAVYQSENGVFCPADDQFNMRRWCGSRKSGDGKFDRADGFLAPYLGKSREVGICPLFKNIVGDGESFESGTGGYGYNAAYIGGRPGGGYDRGTKLRISERLVNVWDPSRTVMFTTTAYARASGLQEYPYCEPPFWDFGGGPSGDKPSPTVNFRAKGKALVAWCDGHVTAEPNNKDPNHGINPHQGDSHEFDLGWFGPEDDNGYWNPRRQ